MPMPSPTRTLALAGLLACALAWGPAHADPPRNDAAIDPFLAGALGFMPFASGLYLGPDPGQGVVFTLLDAATAAGIWTALKSKQGDPDNAPLFFLAMGAANIADAVFSVRKSLHTQKLRITPVTYDASGRVSSSVTYFFD